MNKFIVPVFILILIVYSTIKKNNTYRSFVSGAKSAFELVLSSLPYMVGIFVAIEIFQVSGLSIIFADSVAPVFQLFGIPKELSQLVIIKYFSGCGALAVLENIFVTYGVDSYIARAGCAIAGCSEAIFYITAVYFSKTKVEKYRYAIPIVLVANLLSSSLACLICRVI